jgi:hypothetical protein
VNRRAGWALAFVAGTAALAAGCRRVGGCVGGDDGRCVPPSACRALRSTCQAPPNALLHKTIEAGDLERLRADYPRSSKMMAAVGDVLLQNDLVRVVLDAPDHAQNLSPSGGTIIDLMPIGTVSGDETVPGDQTNAIFQAAGVLPRDAVRYVSKEVDRHDDDRLEETFVSVVFRGHLVGDSRVTVVTRYELRLCEPGVRVRTDLYNGAPDPNTLFVSDGFFWGDNTMAPFAPAQGLGFRSPELDLRHPDRAWREWPLLAARSQGPPDVSYAVVPCDPARAAGFSSPTLTAVGVPLVPTLPGDGIHYERFIVTKLGRGVAPAVAEALRIRSQVHGDPAPVTVTGRVVSRGAPVDGQSGRAASLLFYEPALGTNPDSETRRTPWSEAVPAPNGQFSVTLPPGRGYRVQPYAFGRPAAPPTSFVVADRDIDLGDISVAATAHLTATVQSQPGQPAGPKLYAELVLVPVTPPAATASPSSFYGLYPGCEPMLGPPHAGSPACNRALTNDGKFDLLVPPAQYYVYATRGPFATIDRKLITLDPGDETHLDFEVQKLSGLLPPGVVSADFHVHGSASYDSSIPDQDRLASFLSADLDVIVASDHDVVTSYGAGLDALSVKIIPGVEQTPNISWFEVPGEVLPKTLGHFNFWPLQVNPDGLRRGAPWDERMEPGAMMDAVVFSRDDAMGVRQLNHPFARSKLERDAGFLAAIGYDVRTPIATGASFAADVLLRAPANGHRNIDWDVQEVMTGASRADWLRQRALWFSLLSQGFLRAGAANSDSHSLALERVGYPRNLVFGGHDRTALDIVRFNADVRGGHMVGTNGPVLDVNIADDVHGVLRPGLAAVAPSPTATLHATVRAAPWIPVDEIRFFINGALVHRITVSRDFKASHLGTQVPSVTIEPIPVARLLNFARDAGVLGTGDAWLVVEAGLHQDTPADVDGDGLPDLTDVDLQGRPANPDHERFDLEAIAPGVWPVAFTNPFIFDLDGGGWRPPGLPK